MSFQPVVFDIDVIENNQSFDISFDEEINVHLPPEPINLITNGDFSQAGATTDGWSAARPNQSTLAVTNGKLILTHTTTSNSTYGLIYTVSTQANHIYFIRFKLTKTMSDADGDARVIRVLLGSELASYTPAVTQNTVLEKIACIKTVSNQTTLQILFGGSVNTAAENESMMELWNVEMYDVTDIMPN